MSFLSLFFSVFLKSPSRTGTLGLFLQVEPAWKTAVAVCVRVVTSKWETMRNRRSLCVCITYEEDFFSSVLELIPLATIGLYPVCRRLRKMSCHWIPMGSQPKKLISPASVSQ